MKSSKTSDTKETFSTEEIVEGLTMCPDCEKELRKYVKSKGHCCLACAVNKYLDKEYEPMKK